MAFIHGFVGYIQQKSKEIGLTLSQILVLHKMLMANIRDDIAGRFRQSSEYCNAPHHAFLLGLAEQKGSLERGKPFQGYRP